MVKQLNTNTERHAEKAENLSFCRGIKLLHIRDRVEELLSFIGRSGLFEEYTIHDIRHIDEMLGIVDWLIPASTKEKLTHAEWLMLTLAIYFHDLGMVVTKKEYEDRMKSGFREYRADVLKNADPVSYEALSKDDSFLYQEFVRENHAKRINSWIEGRMDPDLGNSEQVFKEIQITLSSLDKKFKKDLALICESHHEDDIEDFEKYKTKVLYGNDENARVNLNYIAIILRTADLLHITNDRTPSLSMKIINVTNPKSVMEWKKQMAVRAVAPKDRRNEEGNIDDSLEKDTIEITAYFEGADTAEAYFGLSAYLKYAQGEFAKCNATVAKAKKTEGTSNYDFPWKKIDETNIETVGFETKKLQFTLEQESILRLLVGHTLYNDSSVVVRELVQNSIDAVKLQKEIDKANRNKLTDGKIIVAWNSKNRTLSFSDNGTGMTIHDIENYLLKVGSSKYRDDSLKKQFPNFSSISRFGIGILTCFMIADEIDITTSSPEQGEANIVNLRNVNGNYLLRKVEKNSIEKFIRKHGTIVQLHVRNDVDMTNLAKDLKKWIVLPDIPVFLTEDNSAEIQIGFNSLSDVLISSLSNAGIKVDGENYAIFEETSGNVTVAFAIKHWKYLSDWSLMNVSDVKKSTRDEDYLPIGTCIEGIRVEFTTPGYTSPSILAIANVRNSKYKTNVARSAIELDANKEFLSDIYNVYASYLKSQMDELHKKKYSKSWALKECQHLMRPLFHNIYDRVQNDPVDEDILVQSLAQLECIILENQGERSFISAEATSNLSEINIFECKMFQAIQLLFQEIPSTATLNSIVNVACAEDRFLDGVRNIICNYDSSHILHQYALKEKEISSIEVNRSQRRIHLTFSNKASRWKSYEASLRRYETIYIPQNDFVVEGLENEIGVRTIGGIYLNSNSDLCKYLIEKIEVLSKQENGSTLINILLIYIFQTNLLENVYQNRPAEDILKQALNLESDMFTSLWKVLDIEEFSKVVLAKNHSIYSIHNWSRDKKSGYETDEYLFIH